ncbi:MAG: phosphoribosylformylglycinamidine synthase subunit PurS [Candidatus Bathyarchaeia archaeon]
MDRTFSVEVIISNKPQARDPEGETIIRDLIHKNGFRFVKEVRTGKLLVLKIEASKEEEAKNKALLMCNDLRLYNPVAHAVNIRVSAQT